MMTGADDRVATGLAGRRDPSFLRSFSLLLLLWVNAIVVESKADVSLPVSPPEPDVAPLYEAYNQLHALSQEVHVPIDSPTVVVIGRQTDGKSALIEGLMGFQFNHVGGGTKTRRPIALQMQYHPKREQPSCYLLTADGEQQLSLVALQEHIERENHRLEQLGAFATEEIVVRIEYKYCPNLFSSADGLPFFFFVIIFPIFSVCSLHHEGCGVKIPISVALRCAM